MKYLVTVFIIIFPTVGFSSEIKSCLPEKLYFGDKLSIKLETPHGRDFVIKSPNKISFEICFWYPKGDKNSPIPMFQYDDCANVENVEIIAGVTKTGGMNDDQRNFGVIHDVIFSTHGVYKIIVSHNMEAGTPNYSSCKVEYLGKRN